MLKVNEKEFIKSYKQYKKDIRLIKILLKDKWYRTKWCKKYSIETLTDEELEKDLKRHQEEKIHADISTIGRGGVLHRPNHGFDCCQRTERR